MFLLPLKLETTRQLVPLSLLLRLSLNNLSFLTPGSVPVSVRILTSMQISYSFRRSLLLAAGGFVALMFLTACPKVKVPKKIPGTSGESKLDVKVHVSPKANDRLLGNETTSLCAPEAWRDFRVSFQLLRQSHPALILLSTDGYPNSFRDESGFLQVGSDLLSMIQQHGLAKVKDSLAGWLSDSTHAGSGDDVTLGIIYSSLILSGL